VDWEVQVSRYLGGTSTYNLGNKMNLVGAFAVGKAAAVLLNFCIMREESCS